MTADEFETLSAEQAEMLLRNRFRIFLDAGASPTTALLLAAQADVSETEILETLRKRAPSPVGTTTRDSAAAARDRRVA